MSPRICLYERNLTILYSIMWWKNHLGLTWNLMPVCYWCGYMFRLILFFRITLLKYIWWLKYVLYFKPIKSFPIFIFSFFLPLFFWVKKNLVQKMWRKIKRYNYIKRWEMLIYLKSQEMPKISSHYFQLCFAHEWRFLSEAV